MAKILMAIPTEGGIHECVSMVAACLAKRPDVGYLTAQGRPVDFVRNNIIRMFLQHKDFTHLFLLDSDTEPPVDCLDKLLALDAPLASGCYPVLMKDGLRWALANRDTNLHYRLLKRLISYNKPFEVEAGGAGCLLIRRDVFDLIKWPWFKWVEKEDGNQISEDIYFFQKCNDAALKVMVEPAVICNHFKKVNLAPFMLMLKKQENKNVD